MTLLPLNMVPVSAAASGDVYSNELIYYKFNDQCYGRYLTPIQTGKYPTVIMICGQGGDATLRSNMRYYMNEWVKAGIFPPMNVVIPGVDDFDGVDGRHFNDDLATLYQVHAGSRTKLRDAYTSLKYNEQNSISFSSTMEGPDKTRVYITINGQQVFNELVEESLSEGYFGFKTQKCNIKIY